MQVMRFSSAKPISLSEPGLREWQLGKSTSLETESFDGKADRGEVTSFAAEGAQRWDGLTELAKGLGPSLSKAVLTEESVDVKPRVVYSSMTYPEMVPDDQVEGKVEVRVLIDTDGRVRKLKILKASPSGSFEYANEKALPNWCFKPASYKGVVVPVWATIPIVFSP